MLLAGGLARRMGGGDKCLALLGRMPMLAHVIERIRPQAGPLLLNANGDPGRFERFGLPVAPDPIPGTPGPLAGVLAGIRWAERMGYDVVLSLPTDTPFFPLNLAERLVAGRQPGAPVTCAMSAGSVHPVFARWPTSLAARLEDALASGELSVDKFGRAVGRTSVEWPTGSLDPFFNINTPAALDHANAVILAEQHRMQDGI